MRIALGIEYDGSGYAGWQQQQGQPSIQAALEHALGFVANQPIKLTCAGRTDAGVHALSQVAHFDCAVERTVRNWVHGANSGLPNDICVRWAESVSDDFHARFSATARHYRYIIDNRPVRSALHYHRVTWHYAALDADRMHQAAQCLVGEHDFSAFRDSDCQSKTPMRNMMAINVKRDQHWVMIDITANAFLHHMVRNIVGVLLPIGEGKREPSWAAEVLASRDRTQAGVTAPAAGLYLTAVDYPAELIAKELRF